MPTLEYPQPMVAPHGPFAPIPDIPKSIDAILDSVIRGIGVVHLGDGDDLQPVNLRRAPSALAGVTQLHLSVGGDHSTSFHNGADTVKAAAIAAFGFCPGDDDVKISWKVRNEEFIARATLEVYAGRLDGPVSSVDVTAELANGRGVSPGATGGVDLIEGIHFTVAHTAKFPAGVLTVEHSPYRFVLKIMLRLGARRELYPSTAWTFGHVLVESIEVAWGAARLRPAAAQPGVVDPLADGGYGSLERTLVASLATGNLAAAKIDVVLDANVFEAGFLDIASTVPSPFHSNHEALTKVWGDGPRIPLTATVHVATHAGARASTRARDRVLGSVCLLWDWEDDSTKYGDWILGAHPHLPYISREYLKRALELPEPNGPPGSTNCPVAHGGKRGDLARPVFPPIGAMDPFGYEVRAAGGGRPWAAVGVTGERFRVGRSSVLFQPAPIAGDRYRVGVYLTADPADPQAARGDKPMMAVTDVTALVPPPPLAQVPGLHDPPAPTVPPPQLRDAVLALGLGQRVPGAWTGVFETCRKAAVRVYEHPTGTMAGPVGAVRTYYRAFAGTEITADVRPLPNDLLTRFWPGHEAALIASSDHTIITHFSLVNPAAPLNALQLLNLRTLGQFRVLLEALVRTGHVYTIPGQGVARLAERNSAAPLSFVLKLVPGTPLVPAHRVVITADPADALTSDTLDTLGHPLGALKRHLFGPPVHASATTPGTNERRVNVDFNAAGQTRTAVIEFSITANIGKDPLPRNTHTRMVQALRDLEAAIPQGQALDGALTITARGRFDKTSPQRWLPFLVTAANRAAAEVHNVLDVNALVNDFFGGPFGNKHEVLSQAYYTEALRKSMKPIVQNLAKFLRENDGAAWDGTVYLSLTDMAALGNAGIGGNYPTAPIGMGYVTSFPGAGFWQQAGYGSAAVLGHELGHAFWLKHAEAGIFGLPFYDGKNVSAHVPHDTCLMNYDPEPTSLNFCPACMLSIRGWRDPPASLLTVVESTTWLDKEIAAEGNAQSKAWKLLRRAMIEARAVGALATAGETARKAAETAWIRDPRDAPTANLRAGEGVVASGNEALSLATLDGLLDQAELSFGGVHNQPDGSGVSFLRSLVRGRIVSGNIDHAWTSWRALKVITTLAQDLSDALSPFGPMLPGVVTAIVVRENNADVGAPVRQYVNLPQEAKYVDGARVTHRDRAGKKLTLRLTLDGAPLGVKWALIGHRDNPHTPPEEVMPGGFVNAEPNYTLAHVVKASALGSPELRTVDATHADLTVTLPGPGRYKLAIAGVGGTVLSPEITALRMIFVMGTVGSRAANSATAMAGLATVVGTAYLTAGCEVFNVGSEPLAWPDVAMADDYAASATTKRLGVAADLTRDLPCRIPFSPGIATYRDLGPYLYQFLFADVLLHWAGVGRYVQDVDLPQPVARVVLPVKGRGGNGAGMLWAGVPAGLDAADAVVNGPSAYLGATLPLKRWLVRGTFREQGGNAEIPLVAGDVEAQQSDAVNYAGRFDRIELDLARFAPLGGGNLRGRVTIEVLVASFRGGVDMREHAPSHAMALITTTQSWSGLANPALVQQSMAIHELGHTMGMVVSDGTNPDFYNVGGPHCASGLPPAPGIGINEAHYNTNVALATCVMFHRVRQGAPLTTFCDACKAQLRRAAWEKFV